LVRLLTRVRSALRRDPANSGVPVPERCPGCPTTEIRRDILLERAGLADVFGREPDVRAIGDRRSGAEEQVAAADVVVATTTISRGQPQDGVT